MRELQNFNASEIHADAAPSCLVIGRPDASTSKASEMKMIFVQCMGLITYLLREGFRNAY